MFGFHHGTKRLCRSGILGRRKHRGRVRRHVAEFLEPRALLSAAPYGAMPDDTGEFMLGNVDVTVVLMESNNNLSAVNDNSETWSLTSIQSVK